MSIDHTFRDAMAAFPSGVTIVTTVDSEDTWWGFTASSFCSVSMEPPLVLVCLARSAQCHPAFMRANRWAIHVIGLEHVELAKVFASRGADKFAAGTFILDRHGMPVLDQAAVTLTCDAETRYDGGDHSILLGRVVDVRCGQDDPALFVRRAFHPAPAKSR